MRSEILKDLCSFRNSESLMHAASEILKVHVVFLHSEFLKDLCGFRNSVTSYVHSEFLKDLGGFRNSESSFFAFRISETLMRLQKFCK